MPLYSGFWKTLPKPIIGLAPMDGVTDFSCRSMTAKYAKPDVIFTEFVPVEGILNNPKQLLRDLVFDEIERPVVAQLYGKEPADFYKATLIACHFGFDGIDLNMGCPAKTVARRGCGAALIRDPERAQRMMRMVRLAIEDWCAGTKINDLDLRPKHKQATQEALELFVGKEVPRRKIPYSVKTRIGYDQICVEEWIPVLLHEQPAVISVHGRTLKQMYRGQADWESIAKVQALCEGTNTLVFGNGDLENANQIVRCIRESRVDGVLIGRASIGNPWIFQNKEKIRAACNTHSPNELEEPCIPLHEKFSLLQEHAEHLYRFKGLRAYNGVKRHAARYLTGFPNASILRNRIMRTKNPEEMKSILESYPE